MDLISQQRVIKETQADMYTDTDHRKRENKE